jgi:hypothetical protein
MLWLMNNKSEKDLEGSGRGLIYGTILPIYWNEENHKSLNQDSRSPGRDLNPGPPEHETGGLITRLRRSVNLLLFTGGGLWMNLNVH